MNIYLPTLHIQLWQICIPPGIRGFIWFSFWVHPQAQWQAAILLPGISTVLILASGLQFLRTICPASLLQLKTKTRNSKSFIQNQINRECRHLPSPPAKVQNIQRHPMLLSHPLAASELFGCHIRSLQALSKQIFNRSRGFIPPLAAALRERCGLSPAQERLTRRASVEKWGQEGLQASNAHSTE